MLGRSQPYHGKSNIGEAIDHEIPWRNRTLARLMIRGQDDYTCVSDDPQTQQNPNPEHGQTRDKRADCGSMHWRETSSKKLMKKMRLKIRVLIFYVCPNFQFFYLFFYFKLFRFSTFSLVGLHCLGFMVANQLLISV